MNDDKKNGPPEQATPTDTGGEKNEQQTQQATPGDADGKKNEQKSQDSNVEPPKDAPHSRRKIVLAAVAVVALAASAYVVWRVFFAKPKLPDSIVTLSGRIEGDDSAIAPKTHRTHSRNPVPRRRHGQGRRRHRDLERRAGPRAPGTGAGRGFDHARPGANRLAIRLLS